jgi:hypothetical protein
MDQSLIAARFIPLLPGHRLPSPFKWESTPRSKPHLLPLLSSTLLPSSAPALSSRRRRSPPSSHRLSANARAPMSTTSASPHRHLRPWPLPTSSGEPEPPIGRAPVSTRVCPFLIHGAPAVDPVRHPWTRSTIFSCWKINPTNP